jgi:hypothetical protein
MSNKNLCTPQNRDMEQMAGMLFGMIKPILKQSMGIPETEAVKKQVDVIAASVMSIFPQLEIMVTLEDVQGLMYNMKQADLDRFYEMVAVALTERE